MPDASVDDSKFEDEQYLEALWELYYGRLKLAVQSRVRAIRRPVANESEIALSAFHSFVQRAKDGQFPEMADQNDIWRLLKTIALRKANDTRKALLAQKRGGKHLIHGQADLANESNQPGAVELAVNKSPDPSADVEIAEFFNSLLDKLPDDRDRDVLLLKLQGGTLNDIADCLQVSTRTVMRTLQRIEQTWKAEWAE